jgi:chemotaxis protein histidine kinase CheA
MSVGHDPLNFFVLEASDCLERMDAVLSGAGASGPDAGEFVRQARTLRGAAVVHRLTEMADVAGAVERAGRALRDGAVRWTPPVTAALVAAVDDLKILLHNLRIWGPNEEARAQRRIADLARAVPASAEPATRDGGESGSGLEFLAREAMATAAALDAYVRTGSAPDRAALETAIAHARTLRGVASVHDLPPVPDVLDAVDRLARTLAQEHSVPTAPQLALCSAAAALLRRTATDVRSTGRANDDTPEERHFLDARDALASATAEADHILPITELFFGDGREGVVSRAPSPPTTPAERFRLEAVSLAEHLRKLLREAEAAGPGPVSERAATDLRAALRTVQQAAESFGERDAAEFLSTFTEGHSVFDFLSLHAIDELVTSLADPATSAADLSRRMAELSRGRALDDAIGSGFAAHSPPPSVPSVDEADSGDALPHEPAARPAPVVAQPATETAPGRSRTPTGAALQSLLADGIAGMASLNEVPLAEQTSARTSGPVASAKPEAAEPTSDLAPPVADVVVPIEMLLYRGASALERARALRDAMRTQQPQSDALKELYDLLDLVAPK